VAVDQPVKKPVKQKGFVFAYFEQGWEGRIEYAFHDNVDNSFSFLENGDVLTLFNQEGVVLFQDEINYKARRFWDFHPLEVGIWSLKKQKGVSYGKWIQWFWQKPNIKAELTRTFSLNH
jgi:hypothetical protein